MRDPIKAVKQQQKWADDVVEEIKSDIEADELDAHLLLDVLAILGLKLAKTTGVGVNKHSISAIAYMHLNMPEMVEDRLINGEPA
jgi:hypothetical protein